jgi:hypothetical protein
MKREARRVIYFFIRLIGFIRFFYHVGLFKIIYRGSDKNSSCSIADASDFDKKHHLFS